MAKRIYQKKSTKSKGNNKFIIAFLILIAILLIVTVINFSSKLFFSNVKLIEDKEYLYIPTGISYDDLKSLLKQKNIIINDVSFEFTANLFNLKNTFKPGKYKLTEGMSNTELIRMLRSGKQEIVNLTFNNIRLKENFSGFIAKNLEVDSAELLELMGDWEYLKQYDLNPNTSYCVFLPNTYYFYWNTNAKTFFKKMVDEYEKFWTASRKNKLKHIGLSRTETIILASIVDQETMRDSEMGVIARVYLNRLKYDRLLQADPTVVFASKNFEAKRIIGKMLESKSPYNTYKYKGLPPGPISMPSIKSIDAVLNAPKHDYLYFCAKEDFSGYHNFSKTFEEHKLNARKFQIALNNKKINE